MTSLFFSCHQSTTSQETQFSVPTRALQTLHWAAHSSFPSRSTGYHHEAYSCPRLSPLRSLNCLCISLVRVCQHTGASRRFRDRCRVQSSRMSISPAHESMLKFYSARPYCPPMAHSRLSLISNASTSAASAPMLTRAKRDILLLVVDI